EMVRRRLPGLPDNTTATIASVVERTQDTAMAAVITDSEVDAWVRSLREAGVFAAIRRNARRVVLNHLRASPPAGVALNERRTLERIVQLTRALEESSTFQT